MKTDSLGVRMPNMFFQWQCTLHKILSLMWSLDTDPQVGRSVCSLLSSPTGLWRSPSEEDAFQRQGPFQQVLSTCLWLLPAQSHICHCSKRQNPMNKTKWDKAKIETGKRRWHTGILHHFKAGMQTQLWRKIVLFCISGFLHSHAPLCPRMAGTIEHLSPRLPGSTGWHEERTH